MAEALKYKNSETVSKHWAKALIELADEDSSVSKEDVLNDLNFVAQTIYSSEELLAAINNPSISTEEKQIIICKLFQSKVSTMVYNFIFALNLRKKLYLISDIVVKYEEELDILNNVKHINVTSAIELNDKKKEEIKNKIASKLDSGVDINWGIDKEIIAGLIFNIDEVVVDNSIRHKLDDLSNAIIK